MRDHRKLKAFQLADAFVVPIYQATRSFPKEEQFCLAFQMRKAVISVPGNIVEGCARRGHGEYVYHLNVAFGSLRELGYYVELAQRVEYRSDAEAASLTRQYEEIARVLSGLIDSLGDA